MNRIAAILLFFIISQPEIWAQTDVYVVPQIDYGIPLNSHYGINDGLKTRINSYQTLFGLSGRVLFADKLGLEIGIAQNHQSWALRDNGFTSRNKGYEIFTNNNFNYYSYFFATQFNKHFDEHTALYFSLGYAINNVGKDSLNNHKLFVKNNETIDVNAKYNMQTQSLYAEFGVENHVNDNKDLFIFSLKFSYGMDNILTGSYVVSKDGNELNNSVFVSKGSYIGISMKYNFRVFHKDKRVRNDSIPKQHHAHLELEVKKTDNKKRNEVPKIVAGRDVKVRSVIKVSDSVVTIRVYDAGAVDGDLVSLYFNESTIIENYELTKTPFVTTVTLTEGKNIFVLHALNLGSIPPNTAGILIVEGSKIHKLNLESTLKSSGTIEIGYYPNGKPK